MFSKEEELEYEELKRKLAIYDAKKRIERDRIALRDQELYDLEEKKEQFREEGRKEGLEAVRKARNLLKEGCEIDLIVEVTGLSKEQIEKLKECIEIAARNLLKEGCEIELIIKATGLSKEQIEKLR